MSRKLDDIIADLPEDQRQRVEARAEELRQEVISQRQFIPVEESIAEWEKAPEYLRCRAELERDEAMGAFDPVTFPDPTVREKPMSATAAQAFAELQGIGAEVLDRDIDGAEFAIGVDPCNFETFDLPPDVKATLEKHGLEWHWLWHVTWMGGMIGVYPAEGGSI